MLWKSNKEAKNNNDNPQDKAPGFREAQKTLPDHFFEDLLTKEMELKYNMKYDVLTDLLQLYQTAVGFYGNIDETKSKLFQNRMATLLADPIILKLIHSHDKAAQNEPKPSSAKNRPPLPKVNPKVKIGLKAQADLKVKLRFNKEKIDQKAEILLDGILGKAKENIEKNKMELVNNELEKQTSNWKERLEKKRNKAKSMMGSPKRKKEFKLDDEDDNDNKNDQSKGPYGRSAKKFSSNTNLPKATKLSKESNREKYLDQQKKFINEFLVDDDTKNKKKENKEEEEKLIDLENNNKGLPEDDDDFDDEFNNNNSFENMDIKNINTNKEANKNEEISTSLPTHDKPEKNDKLEKDDKQNQNQDKAKDNKEGDNNQNNIELDEDIKTIIETKLANLEKLINASTSIKAKKEDDDDNEEDEEEEAPQNEAASSSIDKDKKPNCENNEYGEMFNDIENRMTSYINEFNSFYYNNIFENFFYQLKRLVDEKYEKYIELSVNYHSQIKEYEFALDSDISEQEKEKIKQNIELVKEEQEHQVGRIEFEYNNLINTKISEFKQSNLSNNIGMKIFDEKLKLDIFQIISDKFDELG